MTWAWATLLASLCFCSACCKNDAEVACNRNCDSQNDAAWTNCSRLGNARIPSQKKLIEDCLRKVDDSHSKCVAACGKRGGGKKAVGEDDRLTGAEATIDLGEQAQRKLPPTVAILYCRFPLYSTNADRYYPTTGVFTTASDNLKPCAQSLLAKGMIAKLPPGNEGARRFQIRADGLRVYAHFQSQRYQSGVSPEVPCMVLSQLNNVAVPQANDSTTTRTEDVTAEVVYVPGGSGERVLSVCEPGSAKVVAHDGKLLVGGWQRTKIEQVRQKLKLKLTLRGDDLLGVSIVE